MDRWLAFCLAILIGIAGTVQAGEFVYAGDMMAERSGHSATLLPDGRVLIVGGDVTGRSAEIYDPVAGTFRETGGLAERRNRHTATLLRDGRVLIVGSHSTVELYDPATGTFQLGPRVNPSAWGAALLADGRMLLVTGLETERFDPFTGVSEPAAPFLNPGWLEVFYDTATLMADGRVLFTGFGPSQVYDPLLDRFTLVGPPDLCELGVCGVEMHTATSLASGKVLVAGGMNDEHAVGHVALAELFDPGANTFAATGALNWRRYTHAAVALDEGRVLVIGGEGVKCDSWDCYPGGSMKSAEMYDSATGKFLYAGDLKVARTFPRATRLNNGDVLVTGGGTFCYLDPDCFRARLSSAELYRASTQPLLPIAVPKPCPLPSGRPWSFRLPVATWRAMCIQ